MAQFDVYSVRGGALVVDCQSDSLADLQTRFVVPLRPVDTRLASNRRLIPTLNVSGERLMLLTPLARGINVKDIEVTRTSLSAEHYTIQGAIDVLVTGV